MHYDIWAGASDCDHEILFTTEAPDEESALNLFAQHNRRVRFDPNWKTWVIGPSRKIWAKPTWTWKPWKRKPSDPRPGDPDFSIW